MASDVSRGTECSGVSKCRKDRQGVVLAKWCSFVTANNLGSEALVLPFIASKAVHLSRMRVARVAAEILE